jgi:acyl-CoA reductase-like NAD-dependent aldehyde dehydrogenase
MSVEIGVPIGGYKCSGSGMRESGTVAVEAYPEVKSIMVDFSGMHRCTGVNASQIKKI